MSETRLYPLADHIRVYRDGRIESCVVPWDIFVKSSAWHPVKVCYDASRGYPYVYVRFPGKMRKVSVHLIVANTWLGLPEAGLVCRHKDDDRMNFHLDNLEYGTNKQNSEDAARNGKIKRGERSYMAKLTDEDCDYIRSARSMGIPNSVVAEELGISRSMVSNIVAGRVRKHPTDWLPSHS